MNETAARMKVELGDNSYDIVIGSGSLAALGGGTKGAGQGAGLEQ
ncbi:MAG TPA: hypothetical protein VHS59_00605 [Bacillota bacterium]|nr:hypothetical protein [Bacillota bacterium]